MEELLHEAVHGVRGCDHPRQCERVGLWKVRAPVVRTDRGDRPAGSIGEAADIGEMSSDMRLTVVLECYGRRMPDGRGFVADLRSPTMPS